MKECITKLLVENSEEKYREFSSNLIPGCRKMYGVRIPTLRKIAKTMAKSQYPECLKDLEGESFEEVLLFGFVIGYVKLPIEEHLQLLREYIPKIDNWSINDSVCSSLKFTQENKEEVWRFLQFYISSDEEFEVRFAVTMMMDYFLEDDYIDRVLQLYESVKQPDYYVMMGIAWALATAYTKFPDKVTAILKRGHLPEDTYQKALHKLIESHCVSVEEKEKFRRMRANRGKTPS